jgi:signal transduction histidine kinase
VTKHAGAQATATVALVREGQALRVAIADDGCGFEPATAEGSRGLTNMRDRIGAVGGMLTVRSTPGAGTTVLASVPNVFPPESEASATPTRE